MFSSIVPTRADGVNYHLPDRGRGIGSRDSFLGFVKVLGFLRPACAFQRFGQLGEELIGRGN